jgi:NADH:ubiquinone oxidoreductase subunit F (NADH-binding)
VTATGSRADDALRLLAGWNATGRRDLAAHLATYGPLPPVGRSRRGSTPELVRAVAQAGLTGRGGAGFPTARKLDALSRAGGAPLVVANGLEGEPASSKDAVLLSCSPHLVLDGADLVAAATRADAVAVCVDRTRPDLVDCLRAALAERGGGETARPVTVYAVPAQYVGGEESALTQWLDGGPALPQFRADKSVPLRVRRRPVLVQNVETLAQVALVARYGAEWFRGVGTPDAPGTALVTLSGPLERPGVHEFALGLPVGAMVSAGGPTEPIRAVLVGGYGGSWVGTADLDTRYSPGDLATIGAAPGAGVLACIGPSSCGIAETARVLAWLADQSAGQCGPCRFGLPALADDVTALARGHADGAVLDRLHHRLGLVHGRGACGHPDGAVRLVRSALRVFAEDVDDHRRGRPCTASRRPPVLPIPGWESGRRTGREPLSVSVGGRWR